VQLAISWTMSGPPPTPGHGSKQEETRRQSPVDLSVPVLPRACGLAQKGTPGWGGGGRTERSLVDLALDVGPDGEDELEGEVEEDEDEREVEEELEVAGGGRGAGDGLREQGGQARRQAGEGQHGWGVQALNAPPPPLARVSLEGHDEVSLPPSLAWRGGQA